MANQLADVAIQKISTGSPRSLRKLVMTVVGVKYFQKVIDLRVTPALTVLIKNNSINDRLIRCPSDFAVLIYISKLRSSNCGRLLLNHF
jgi:hypothetical protein